MIKVLKTIIKGKTKKVVKMSKGDCFLRRHLILSRQRATRASYNNEGYLECCWILSGVCLSFFRYVSMSACLLVSQSIKGCFQGTPLAKGYVWEGKGGGRSIETYSQYVADLFIAPDVAHCGLWYSDMKGLTFRSSMAEKQCIAHWLSSRLAVQM